MFEFEPVIVVERTPTCFGLGTFKFRQFDARFWEKSSRSGKEVRSSVMLKFVLIRPNFGGSIFEVQSFWVMFGSSMFDFRVNPGSGASINSSSSCSKFGILGLVPPLVFFL